MTDKAHETSFVAESTGETVVLTENHPLHDDVIKALKTVYDPEIPADIYELGLIYEVRVDPGNDVYIKMTLTSPACPVAETLPPEVEQKVKNIPDVNNAKVELTFDPPWDKEMMSEEARMELGFW